MNKITKQDVQQAAQAHGLTVIEALTRMQAVAAKAGDAALLNRLCEIKGEIVGL